MTIQSPRVTANDIAEGSGSVGPPPNVDHVLGSDIPAAIDETRRIIAAGLDLVARLDAEPIVVVPTADYSTIARNVIVAEPYWGRTDEAHADAGNRRDPVLLFPGSAAALEGGIRGGRLPRTARAFVFDDGRWRLTVAPRADRQRVDPQRDATAGSQRAASRHLPRVMSLLRDNHWARRIQPLVDTRENEVLSTLLDPGEFPYRMSRAVEKRVLLAISSLSNGGAERQIINTAEGLRAHGLDDVHMLVEHLDAGSSSETYVARAHRVASSVQGMPDHADLSLAWVRLHPRFRKVLTDGLLARVLSASAIISRLSPQVVQASLDWTNITIGLAAVLAGVPKVFISGRNLGPHHFQFFQWFMYPCYRALARCPDVYFLNNSDAGRNDYAKWLRLGSGKIRVLRNGLHTDEFRPLDSAGRAAARAALDVPAGRPVVSGAFRFSSEKRPLLWIDAAGRIKAAKPDTIFLLCGVGPLVEAARARAVEVGLGDSIRFLGSRGDIAKILGASDVVMQTSLQEGTPNVLIEAQASGIPVVTPPAFGAAEAVETGVTGHVVHPCSAATLAQSVLSILDDAAFRLRAATAGPRFIEHRFGFDRMALDTFVAFADAELPWALAFLPKINRKYVTQVPLSRPRPDGGKAWIAALPSLAQIADCYEHGSRSPLIVFEDDLILGPSHSLHKAIRADGGGRYSHWGDSVLFSTSDGTDPNVNGRRYTVAVPRRREPA